MIQIQKGEEGILVHPQPVHETLPRNTVKPAIGSYTSQSHMWVGIRFRAAHTHTHTPRKVCTTKVVGKLHTNHMRANTKCTKKISTR